MLKEFKEKIQKVKRTSSHMWANDSFSFHRLFIFLTSYNGQKRILNFAWKTNRYFFRKLLGIKPDQSTYYEIWMRKNFPDAVKLLQYRKEITGYTYCPLISILIHVTDTSVTNLKQLIDSITNQVYENWELLISDEKVIDPLVKNFIADCVKNDNRIKVTATTPGNPFEKIKGEYLSLPGCNGQLSADSLYHYVRTLNENKEANLIYSDEDKTDKTGKHSDGFFKPDWCPDSFLSRNYIGRAAIFRKDIVEKADCTRLLFEPGSYYDMLLRITEKAQTILHIPYVLYHDLLPSEPDALTRRPESSANDLEAALNRRNIKGTVTVADASRELYSIRYRLVKPGKVSIIIPSKNKTDLCKVAVSSVFQLTDYPDFEVIMIDNNSDEPEFFEFLKHWEHREPVRFRHIKDTGEFNFSRLMNNGVSHAKGSYLLLLNNDTEITHADWMTAMVEQCQFETTGAVGVKLLYKNDTIQHAGVIIGLGGIAGHSFVGFDRNSGGYHNFLKCVNNYSAVTAACLMVRKEVYEAVGGFDEELAIEYNDIDFCLKLKERGLSNIYLPHVTLYHYESVSRGHPHKTRKSHKQHLSDVGLFKKRWKNYIDHDPCYNPHLTRIFTDFRIGA